ncbi:MAG: 4Fe-4S dicluster domain-containing protein [Armatimonadetes bacterium]|nr:4Fe-4S dicluster domain-containing protein [Armatimonadota bacterium]MDE2207646.1 4Fe-4S dicluster domain-containing protein [Armatimonadota bacterium]
MINAIRRLFQRTAPADAPVEREQTGFFTDTTLCIGCKACEVACKQWNQLPADGMRFSGRSYDNTIELSATTWRHVAFIEQPAPGGPPAWLMMSDVCKHCNNAPCREACPTGAIITNEFGSVYIQPDVCNGCGYCISACPFGVIGRSAEDGHAHKCTMCYDRQRNGMTPACAQTCPTESIQFGPIEELRHRARARLDALRSAGVEAGLYGAEPSDRYGAMNAFFLLTDAPEVYGLPSDPVRPSRGMARRYGVSLLAGIGLTALAAMLLRGNRA